MCFFVYNEFFVTDEIPYNCESEIDMEFIQNLLFNNGTDYIIENNVDLNDSLSTHTFFLV